MDILNYLAVLVQQQHVVVAVRHIAKLIPEEVWVGHTSVYPLVETR